MADSSASDQLLTEREKDDQIMYQPLGKYQSKGHRQRRWLQAFVYLTLALSLLLNMFLVSSTINIQNIDKLTINNAQRYWSPIMDSIRIRYQTVLFNVTLFSKSIYRQDASDEVDQAWLDLGLTTTQIIPEQEFARVGFSPGMVKVRSGGFIAQMEVFHQLHCLDTLRQGLYFNYEYYHTNRHGVWGRSDAVVRKHMGHCLDLLRIQLQCTADLGLVGMKWVNASGTLVEFAEFKTEHKCRDFEKIREWAKENDRKGVVEWREGDVVLDGFP